MACQELVELVTDYLEGALSAADRQRFEAHLADCSGCQVYLEQMRQTIRGAHQLTPETIAPSVRDELLRVFRGWKSRR